MLRKHWPLLVILLVALLLRAWQLTSVPPGLTHDEANHGREAIEILDGVLRYYFPLNYGSEPLYSYTVAGMMALLGETLFALRFVNVVFGLLAIAATYIWAGWAFDQRTAVLAAALMAVSFWPLAASREALRAGMLPFFMTVTVWFFWRIVQDATAGTRRWWPVIGFAAGIVATFHIYLAARTAWLLFPAFLLVLLVAQRNLFRRAWLPALTGLGLAALGVAPMFLYLRSYPESQTRLDMLDNTLQQLLSGDLGPIVQNAADALLAFVWPGFGDQFLAYNIPGRPVLDALTAAFFVIGIGVCLWRWRQPAYSFTLLWWLTGIIPSLVTGATANTTRNLAALPAVYLLPVLGFTAVVDWLARRVRWNGRRVGMALAVAWLSLAAFVTLRDYFWRWAQLPEVRGAYQSTLVAELNYLADQPDAAGQTILSTVYPGPAHDPSIALVLTGDTGQRLRWVDARQAFMLPAAARHAIIPASTPPHAAFAGWLTPLETVELRPDDPDPRFTRYAVDTAVGADWRSAAALARFGTAVDLVDARWLHSPPAAGTTAELLTVWRVVDPAAVGPVHPPAYTTDAVLFTQLLSPEGAVLAQHDSLEAPSWNWQAGDLILQIHPITLPADAGELRFTTIVGIYDRVTGQRLPVADTPDDFYRLIP